jgi:hypothetical protein
MDLTTHVEALRGELLATAGAAGAEDRALVERLMGALDPALRLVLLDVVTATAAEITTELAPGSVDVRLRGRDPEFVVTSPTPPSDAPAAAPSGPSTPVSTPPSETDVDEGATARLTLRMPEQLKVRVEDAAGRDGVSVNSWLVRAVTDAVAPGGPTRSSAPSWSAASGGQRFTGWAR